MWIAAWWWGGLTTIGFVVVPLLFAHLPDKAIAGNMAARLFGVQAQLSAVLGVALVLASNYGTTPPLAARARRARPWVLAAVVLGLLVEFAIAPRILTRVALPLWHGLGSAMLLLQWLCTAVVLWQMVRPQAGPDPGGGRAASAQA